MKQQRKTGIVLGLVGVITLSILGLIGCQEFDHDSPTESGAGTAAELAGYAQMDGGSVVVEGQQLNWVISDWGALPYEEWMYVEVNQQDAQGAAPGEHQVPVTLGSVSLNFSGLPDAVTAIVIGVKAVHDDADPTITERGRFPVVDGSISIPLDYADLVYSFGITHYSIWFQALGGENGEGVSAGAVITLSGVMPGGAAVSLSRSVRFGTNPAPTPTATTPTTPAVADADGDGVPDASDNCLAVPNPHQVATDAPGCRFINNTDGTITDATTGKMWEQNANVSGMMMNWDAANGRCNTLTTGGYTDWRLPGPSELGDELHNGGISCFTMGPFAHVQCFWYWGTDTDDPPYIGLPSGHAWYVNLTNGDAFSINQSFGFAVWCVRG